MRKRDKTFIEDLENELSSDLREKVFINNVSQLKDFPFKDYYEICQAYKDKRISLSSDYSYERLSLYATKSELLWHIFWLSLPFVIVILDITLAIVLKKYILLFGCITALLGYFTSSPYFKPRNTLAGLITIISIIYIFINWEIAVILGSFSLSLIFTMTARESYHQVIISRALYSETFFVWLFLASTLLVRDNNTKKIIHPID